MAAMRVPGWGLATRRGCQGPADGRRWTSSWRAPRSLPSTTMTPSAPLPPAGCRWPYPPRSSLHRAATAGARSAACLRAMAGGPCACARGRPHAPRLPRPFLTDLHLASVAERGAAGRERRVSDRLDFACANCDCTAWERRARSAHHLLGICLCPHRSAN